MSSLLQLVFLLTVVSQSVDPTPTPSAFEADENYVHAAIESGDVASAMIASSSVLYHWQNDALFGEMIDHLMFKTYLYRPPEEIMANLNGRLTLLDSGAPWEIWLETGVIALAHGIPEAASRCFAECLKDGAIPENPYARLLMGRSLLQQGQLPEAQAAYLDAISAASQDASTAFHVRFLYVNDLYKAGMYPLAQCGEGPICESLISPYPLERAYGIYETLMYAWSINDTAEITRLTNELEAVLPEARARPDSPFESRRIKEAQNFLRRIKQAQAGDDYTAMILDEEAGWFDRSIPSLFNPNYAPIRNRLQKWVTKHPITEYKQLGDEEQRFALRSTHYAYMCAAARTASPEMTYQVAEQGLRDLIENVPVDEKTKGEVITWHLSLANCVAMQNRFGESMDVLERARGLVTPGTLYDRILQGQIYYVTRTLRKPRPMEGAIR